MTWDQRVKYLLRAASRAEGEGDSRVAELFRRMAADAEPPESRITLPRMTGRMECCPE